MDENQAWNREVLRNNLLKRYSSKGKTPFDKKINDQLIIDCIRTIGEKLEFSRYHYQEHLKLIEQEAKNSLAALEFLDATGLSPAFINIKANIVACFSNMHGLLDSLSVIIFLSIKDDITCYKGETTFKPNDLSDISMKRLKQWLNKESNAKNLNNLIEPIQSIVDTTTIVDIFSNTQKHSFIPEIKIKKGKNEEHHLYFAIKNSKKPIRDTNISNELEKSYKSIEKNIRKIGNILNKKTSTHLENTSAIHNN